MRLFIELARRAFQRQLTYRTALFAGLATNFLFGILRGSVLLALVGSRTSVGGYTTADVLTYVALTQAVIAYLSLFGWYDVMNAVHTGEIAADLLKPMSLLSFWLAQDCGRAAANLLLRGVLIMLMYALIFPLQVPQSPGHWLLLFLAVTLSWLVSFAYRFLINLGAFWTPNARGIGRFGFVIVWFFSGFLMPLRFFPAWLQRLASLTPFPHMLNTVADVFVDALPGPALWQALLSQALWAAGLLLAAHLLLKAGIRRLVILGG